MKIISGHSNNQKNTAAYSSDYQGFEFVYLVNKKEKILLFENKLAIRGIWLSNKQVAKMVEAILDLKYIYQDKVELASVGDHIIIESYKHRGIGVYGKDGLLSKQTPDVTRSLEVIN